MKLFWTTTNKWPLRWLVLGRLYVCRIEGIVMFGLVALVDILLDLLRGTDVTLAFLLFIATASPVRLLKRVR
jgi:hypothetical protein